MELRNDNNPAKRGRRADNCRVDLLRWHGMKAAGFTHDNKDNLTVDWYTPPYIFDALGVQFDLDPCAPVGGVPWIPAAKHYTVADDGLAQQWNGSVWCNPPYGKYTGAWMDKMNRHKNGIALVFSRTDCKWFHEYVANADALLFLKGRVKFVDAYGATGGSGVGSGSMLAAWGADNVTALSRMAKMGWLVINSRYSSSCP